MTALQHYFLALFLLLAVPATAIFYGVIIVALVNEYRAERRRQIRRERYLHPARFRRIRL